MGFSFQKCYRIYFIYCVQSKACDSLNYKSSSFVICIGQPSDSPHLVLYFRKKSTYSNDPTTQVPRNSWEGNSFTFEFF